MGFSESWNASDTLKELPCRPIGPATFFGAGRFDEYKFIQRRMPSEVGPGSYNIWKADNFIGRKRPNFCISKHEKLWYGGAEMNSKPGFIMVGNALQFDE